MPTHVRGVVTSVPDLYFVGLPLLYSLNSALVGGVGRDAEYVVRHIAARIEKHGSISPALST